MVIILQLANQYWAPYAAEKKQAFDPKVVNEIYTKEIKESK
jgi:hypothetical protein